MYSKVKSFGFTGLDTFCVDVEIDISRGLPSFDIVGLPDTTVKESKDRVKASIKNCNFSFPVSKITVNLAPADIKKYGPIYDLPIFIGILKSSSQFDHNIDDYAFFGELSLNGDIRSIYGALPMVLAAYKNKIRKVFVPKDNANECSIMSDVEVYPVSHIDDIFKFFNKEKNINPTIHKLENQLDDFNALDFKDVKGQEDVKNALCIAAAGGHNVLMIGPPCSGKSMLSKRMPSILPNMSFDEIIETTMLHSIAGNLKNKSGLINIRPFRSPHHTVSAVGLSGGGSNPKPGEISLAHNGVLFLDEFPEFSKTAMEILRQPVEDNKISISRANMSVTYPSNIMLIAAMNPCPCGNFGHPTKECVCSLYAIKRYLNKISGPLLDRFDIHIEVPPITYSEITNKDKLEESSISIKKRVNNARKRQQDRYFKYSIKNNAKITSNMIKEFCSLSKDAEKILKLSFEKLSLSARAYDKVLKTSLTISDLDNSDVITSGHISTAISYRSLDKKYWQSI
ncbi:MAG: YifB family Mg chelatase-like AAA ATPase [Oscillospiraceae bacterium]